MANLQITLSIEGGPNETTTASAVLGDWAVTEVYGKPGKWTLTHIPSGKCVGSRFTTRSTRRARAMLKAINARTWDLDSKADQQALCELLANG